MVHLIYNTRHDDVSNSSKQQVATNKVEKKKVTTTSQQRNTSTTSITPPSMTSAVLQRQRSARREKRRRELEQRRAKQQQQQQQQRKDDEYAPSPKTLGLELVASPVMLAKNTIDDSITSDGGDDEPSSNFIDVPLTEEKDNEVQEEEEFIIVDKRKSGGSSNKHGYISRDGTLTSNVELELICATPEKKCMLIEKGEQVINLQSTEVEESSSTLYDNEYPIDEIERNNSIRRGNTLTSKESQLLSMMSHYEGSSPDLILDDETYDYSDDGDDISTVINYSSSEYNTTSAWYMNVLDSLCECVGQYLPEEDVSDLISCSDDSEWS